VCVCVCVRVGVGVHDRWETELDDDKTQQLIKDDSHEYTHTHTHTHKQPPTQMVRRTMAGGGHAPPATGWEGEVRKVLKEDWQVSREKGWGFVNVCLHTYMTESSPCLIHTHTTQQ
jgi:hypothetical protein